MLSLLQCGLFRNLSVGWLLS
jgi:hypothetical protein